MRAIRAVPILHSAPHSNRVPHVRAQDVSGGGSSEVERGETHRDGRSKSSTRSAVLEATIKSGARTNFAESSRVFLPNSRRRYGPRPVAMRKHCRLLRVAVSGKHWCEGGGGATMNAPQGGTMLTPSGRSGGVAMGAEPPPCHGQAAAAAIGKVGISSPPSPGSLLRLRLCRTILLRR